MIDTQKRAVLAAISAAEEYTTGDVDIPAACRILGVDYSRVRGKQGPGVTVTGSTASISPTTKPMTALHALAHLATPDVFPTHGSEFCENLIKVTRELYPMAADALVASLDNSGAHYSDEHRRRAVIKSVVQRAVDGTSRVEAVFGAPPQRVEGSFKYDRRAGTITVDDKDFELHRLRYLSRIG